ncbi:MAG: acyltransferase family protein [Clostridia bacterium]|nr:acyltransferase family protein [Clostridia bacterium]MBO7326552.1 acyltransferase family protein [Clostridia bacterium]
MKKRNSIIELYRFIFAINVLKSHDFLPFKGNYFGFGRLSVEFFFILSGFLLVKSMQKHLDNPFLSSPATYKPFLAKFVDFMFSKVKAIWIPLVVAIPFNIAFCLLMNSDVNIWGFLWYVEKMFICFAVCFVVKYFIKDERKFIVITAMVAITATIFNTLPEYYERGIVRAVMGISIGILASYIPPLKLKKKGLIWLPLIPTLSAVLYMLIFGTNMITEKLLQVFLYPLMIYLTFQIKFENKCLNYLGSLSFGIYAFQCVVRPFPTLGINNVWILFGIIMALAILEDALKRVIKYRKNRMLQL